MSSWTLGQLTHRQHVMDRLATLGFEDATAAQKADQLRGVARHLISVCGDDSRPAAAWCVPGRIEVFGKHTDYAGGRSVVAAAERGFCGVAVAREDRTVRAFDVGQGQAAEFSLDAATTPIMGDWSNYPMTVAKRMVSNFATVHLGAELAFASDLPSAAGMSSSSALMVMTFLLLGELNRVVHDEAFQANIRTREDLAGYLGTIENGQTFRQLQGDRGVGTFGGSEDHTAILLAEAGRWVQYAYCPVRLERVISAPPGYRFAIGVSGVVAEKTGAARELYNCAARRALAVKELLARGREDSPAHLAELLQADGGALLGKAAQRLRATRHPEFSSAELIDRWEQFVTENEEIIPAIPIEMGLGDLELLGTLAARSQQLGADKLGNQIPETIFLAAEARRCGAVASSAQGAGFGGSVWALVEEARIEQFMQRWSAAYERAYPAAAEQASFFATRPGPPASSLSGDTTIVQLPRQSS